MLLLSVEFVMFAMIVRLPAPNVNAPSDEAEFPLIVLSITVTTEPLLMTFKAPLRRGDVWSHIAGDRRFVNRERGGAVYKHTAARTGA